MESPASSKTHQARPGAPAAGRPARLGPRTVAGIGAGLALYTWVWAGNAFLTDDPYIVFRTIEQLLAGHGLRFNVHERVQAFTDPLWLFLLSLPRLLGVALPEASLALSWLAMVGFLLVLFRLARGHVARWATVVLVAAVSRTLLDWSSSGLETPLVALLVGLFTAELLRLERLETAAREPSSRRFFLLVSALLLTRPDLALLAAPAASVVAWRRIRTAGWRPALSEVACGGAPFIAWSLGSLFYYGSIFPNTALAKLESGVSARQLVGQGLAYLRVSALWDPLLLPLVFAAAWAAWRTRRTRALAAGGALYLVYVVRVGGDYMAGRFLLPVAALAICLVAARLPLRPLLWGMLPMALLVGALWSGSPVRTLGSYRSAWTPGGGGSAGIYDMKGFEQETLAMVFRGEMPRPHSYPTERPCVARRLGRLGYRAALDQIVIDPYGLADPFLARLRYQPPWQIGHFWRAIPEHYLESVATGENRFVDPALHSTYRDVRTVVSAPLLDPRRVASAWRLLGQPAIALAPRCPELEVGKPPASGRWPVPVRVTSTRREPGKVVVRGVLPLGAHAQLWKLWVDDSVPVSGAHLTCRPLDRLAALDFELSLELGKETAPAAAGRDRPRLVLLRDEALPLAPSALCAALPGFSGIDRPAGEHRPPR